ncbi:hypothetical protein ANN_01592 [Periplaneta americana]|uniref:Histone-lysine N-methyltransferase SETMAR n=1 Tax=Periplaneta americana TaxID=6978 RepID=A0ABQ8TX05_PERAM|nr:hypothetical protein ANN_01592 [Periplaneta americana]
MHWRHSGSPVRTKFKQTLSVRKVMCTVFWDRKGILLIDFLPRGETVNADRYCETLRKLRHAIQNKRLGMLIAGVVLLHDNARPHTARRTAAVLTEFGWELFDHPPYSSDLAPSDFHVFLHLKKFLSSGERFGNDEELKTSVTRWFHSQAAEFYDRGIQKLIPRYDKETYFLDAPAVQIQFETVFAEVHGFERDIGRYATRRSETNKQMKRSLIRAMSPTRTYRSLGVPTYTRQNRQQRHHCFSHVIFVITLKQSSSSSYVTVFFVIVNVNFVIVTAIFVTEQSSSPEQLYLSSQQ